VEIVLSVVVMGWWCQSACSRVSAVVSRAAQGRGRRAGSLVLGQCRAMRAGDRKTAAAVVVWFPAARVVAMQCQYLQPPVSSMAVAPGRTRSGFGRSRCREGWPARVSLALRMRSSQRARRRCGAPDRGSCPRPVLVANAVSRQPVAVGQPQLGRRGAGVLFRTINPHCPAASRTGRARRWPRRPTPLTDLPSAL